LAGDTSVGADGVDEPLGFTVSAAVRVTPAYTALIVAVVVAVTEVVVTVNVLLVEPAGTVTLADVDAADELSDSATTAPPLGAAALNVTVPVEELPPVTLVGLSETAESVGPVAPDGLIVSVALCVTFSCVAEMTTVDVCVTCAAFTVNVALVWPSGTTTLNGTVASTVLLLTRSTTALPAERNLTVPVNDAGPTTVLGFSVTDATACETTRNRLPCTVVPAAEAVMGTAVVCVTGCVFAVNDALV
jgi:hypothetical protein